MKYAAILLIAPFLVSLTPRCTATQQETGQQTQEIQEKEVYNEIDETLLDKDSYVEIGSIILSSMTLNQEERAAPGTF